MRDEGEDQYIKSTMEKVELAHYQKQFLVKHEIAELAERLLERRRDTQADEIRGKHLDDFR